MSALLTKHQRHDWTLVYDRTGEWKECEAESQPVRKPEQPTASDVRSKSSLHGTQHKKKDLDHKVASEAKRSANWTLVYHRTHEWKEYEVPSQPDRKTNQPSATNIRSQSAQHGTQHKKTYLSPKVAREAKRSANWTLVYHRTYEWQEHEVPSQPVRKSIPLLVTAREKKEGPIVAMQPDMISAADDKCQVLSKSPGNYSLHGSLVTNTILFSSLINPSVESLFSVTLQQLFICQKVK
jgi:hypothetical protein